MHPPNWQSTLTINKNILKKLNIIINFPTKYRFFPPHFLSCQLFPHLFPPGFLFTPLSIRTGVGALRHVGKGTAAPAKSARLGSGLGEEPKGPNTKKNSQRSMEICLLRNGGKLLFLSYFFGDSKNSWHKNRVDGTLNNHFLMDGNGVQHLWFISHDLVHHPDETSRN